MAKDYYFQHDHNPTTDPKMQAMLAEYGPWGYGLFWQIVEMLHREADNTILLKRYVFASFAQHKSTSVEQVEKFIRDCIDEFELFHSDGICFWSERVKRNMGKREEIRGLRSKAGKASAEKRERERQQVSTHVEQVSTHVEHNSTKEKKRNEKKGNEINLSAVALIEFDVFWDKYAKKTDREKSMKAWNKLNGPEREAAMKALPDYIAATPDPKFRKNPLTWLNGKCWKDEGVQPINGEKCPLGNPIDRMTYPNWPKDKPFTPSNIVRFNQNWPLRADNS